MSSDAKTGMDEKGVPENSAAEGTGKFYESGMDRVISALFNHALRGAGPLNGASELADRYMRDKRYRNSDERADAMIRNESVKNFGTAFISGLGGGLALPVTVPASLYSTWVLQTRLACAIAALYGYSSDDDRVRTFILLSILGNAGRDVVKSAGVKIAGEFTSSMIKKLPAEAIKEIYKRTGLRLLTAAGERGGVNLMRLVPLAGGIMGGIIDSAACLMAGKAARKFFGSRDFAEIYTEKYNMSFHAHEVSSLLKAGIKQIRKLSVRDDKIISLSVKGVPFRIQFEYLGLQHGEVRLGTAGSAPVRKVVKAGIERYLAKAEGPLPEYVFFSDNVLHVDINDFIEDRVPVKGLALSDLKIQDSTFYIYLKTE